MPKKTNTTKSRIVNAAWNLFYENGYENTTVDEIIARSGTSKGSFYHYFSSKDSLLSSLSYVFDEKYRELEPNLTKEQTCFEKLMYLNQEMFKMIENKVDINLLSGLLSTQLVTKGEKNLLDYNRYYYKLIRKIVEEGQSRGEINSETSTSEIVKLYAMCERALMYDWCICNGEYSLPSYAKSVMPVFLSAIRL